MKYFLYTLYTLFLVSGCYFLYEEIGLILDNSNAEPFFGVTTEILFIATGLIGIIFTRSNIISGIITATGSLLLTFGLVLTAIEIDAKLYGVPQDPFSGYIASFAFFTIGLITIIYGVRIKQCAKYNA